VILLPLTAATGPYLVYVAVRRTTTITLPEPDGLYPIGRISQVWTDPQRSDPLSPTQPVQRRLAVWIWYPASPVDTPISPYAPGEWNGLQLGGLPGLGESSFQQIRTHVHDNIPTAPGRFPMVIFEPGLGFAALQYSSLAEQIASHGYLVVAVTPTFSANLTVLENGPVHQSPNGNPPSLETDDLHSGAAASDAARLLQIWAADARFARDQTQQAGRSTTGILAGHVDGRRIAYLGHSFGGAAALQACTDDPRCQAAADLDGTQFGDVVHRGLRTPLLLIGSQNSCITGSCTPTQRGDQADQQAASELITHSTGPVWRCRIQGAEHFNFTDYGAYYLAAPCAPCSPLDRSVVGARSPSPTPISLPFSTTRSATSGSRSSTPPAPRSPKSRHHRFIADRRPALLRAGDTCTAAAPAGRTDQQIRQSVARAGCPPRAALLRWSSESVSAGTAEGREAPYGSQVHHSESRACWASTNP